MTATRRARSQARHERAWSYVFVAPITAQLLLFFVVPVSVAVYASFTDWNVLSGKQSFVGLENFGDFLTDRKFWIAAGNTLFMLIPIPFYLAFGLFFAIASHRRTPGNKVFRVMYFLPYVSSIVALVVMWKWLFNSQFGPINQGLSDWFGISGPDWLGDPAWIKVTIVIMIVWKMIGITSIYYLAALNNIPDSYYEAARLDGASGIRTFFSITLPMLSPVTFFLIVVGIVGSLQTFVEVQLFTKNGGPNYSAATITYYIWEKAFSANQMGYASAVAVFFALVILVITLIQFRVSRRWVHTED